MAHREPGIASPVDVDVDPGGLERELYSLAAGRGRVIAIILLTVNVVLLTAFDLATRLAGFWEQNPSFRLVFVWRLAVMLGAGMYLLAYQRAGGRSASDLANRRLAITFVVFGVAAGSAHAILTQFLVRDLSIWALAMSLVAVALPVPGRTRPTLYVLSLVVVLLGVLAVGISAGEFIALITNSTCIAIIAGVLDHITFQQYAHRYEAQVQAEAERSRAEELLLNMLPAAIASRLKAGESRIADGHSEVSILFADIGGFTQLAAVLPPGRVVQILDELFSSFDRLVERHGVEKIKTIGDAYMAAAGLPEEDDRHAHRIADLALDMRRTLQEFNDAHDTALQLRIGMHSGYVVAGVIGRKRFLYDLWGESVNLANRMERHGVPGEIQVSQATRELLRQEYLLRPRGQVDLKGVGATSTYFLDGRRAPERAFVSAAQ